MQTRPTVQEDRYPRQKLPLMLGAGTLAGTACALSAWWVLWISALIAVVACRREVAEVVLGIAGAILDVLLVGVVLPARALWACLFGR